MYHQVKNTKYHTVETYPKYHTVKIYPKYNTVETYPKYHTVETYPMKGEGLWYLTPLSTIFQYRYGKLKRYILKIITFNVHFFGK
jgi:hypothetical protein